MKSWSGSAGICINEQKEMLMVRSVGTEKWAVPSGGIEVGESPEECCGINDPDGSIAEADWKSLSETIA
ncbi:NUDIX hydrolase [Sporosarcina highlanderae]|uniref:NUDIX domain-containing protein n=1 Tax=Sporosarcina highlanderae TaxID=3035916 RepID=A0ABT8JSW9_9BACL|nr:NUDIX domain-containing protein [Sporosarcina highlanderae]MDN4607244.1 NUDIX domain-containing protein [Sporosarcina highlanderae]